MIQILVKVQRKGDCRIKQMKEIRNLDDKRVCDVSTDNKAVEIRKKGCVTRIIANPDGTLNITQERIIPIT